MEQGAAVMELEGGGGQNAGGCAGEVVLTRAESRFAALLLSAASDDPLTCPDPDALEDAGELAGVNRRQSSFLLAWIRYKGDLISLADEGGFSPSDSVRYLKYPSSLRILADISKRCCDIPPPIPTKEELAAVWGMVSRMDGMPLTFQKEARQELAKLMGYYLTPSDGNVNVGVQVILKGDLTND